MEVTVNLLIIALTVILSFWAWNRQDILQKMLHIPHAEHNQKEYYRLLSSGFVHKDTMHLLVNMYVLFMFGNDVEFFLVQEYGTLPGRLIYLSFYLLCIIAASLKSYFQHKDNYGYRALGASGAVSGILLIFVIVNPLSSLYFIFFPFFPIPAFVIGIGYLIYSSWASKKRMDNVGHDAHLYGGLFGVLFMLIFQFDEIISFFAKIQSLFL